MRKIHPAYVMAIIFLFSIILTLINYIWIKNNISHIPPPWDTAWYIHLSLNDYDALRNGGIPQFIKTFIEQDPYHAPLLPATGILSFLIFGPHINAAYLINAVYLFILISSVFFITDKLAGGKAAILSAFSVATFPAVIAFSRDYFFEFPLAALTALSYLFLIRSDSFRNRKDSFFFGIFAGLSVLTKTMGTVFFVMPFFYALYIFLRGKDPRTRRNIVLCFFTALLVASIFYVPNFNQIFAYLFGFGFGEAAKPYAYGVPSLLSVRNWTVYLETIAWRGVSAGYVLIFLLSIIGLLLAKEKKLSKEYLLIWLWFIFGYILLSIPTTKGGERFALPILAPVAVVMGVHIAKIPLKPLRSFLVAAIIVTGLTNYIYQTSSESCGFKEIHYKNIPILQPIHISCYVKNIDGLSVPYDKDWDIMPILLYMDGIHASARPVNVLIGFDHHFLNSCTIQLYAELGRLRGTLHSKFTIDGLANRHLTEDEIRRFIEQSDFIITKTGFQGYDFSNRQNDVVTRFMSARTPIKTFAMTDGSTVSLYSWGSEEGP